MFDTGTPDRAARDANRVTPLGGHVTIDGDVEIIGAVSLAGRISGSLRCRSLVIEPGGELQGYAVCDHIVVAGTVIGEIFANTIILKEGSTVEGDAYHQQFILESGAFFEGKSRRHSNPQSLADSAPE
jgi:cytoskeletal protein CcmA (bactofilin family)